MTREGALLVILGVVVLLLGLGVLAWRRRAHRDSGIVPPLGEIPADAAVTHASSGFYVATTRRDQPLERLAVRGLGFRSRADVTVTSRGVALELPGQPSFFVPIEAVDAAETATVAIDRVVEPGGLVRLAWRADRTDGTREPVDTYLRPQDGSALSLAAAIEATLPPAVLPPSDSTATPTGHDA